MSNFKWGFSSLGAPEMSMEELVGLAQKQNINFMEVRTVENSTDLPKLFDKRFPDPNDLKTLLTSHNVTLLGLNSGFRLLNNNDESRNDLLEFGRWATLLDVPYIRIFGGLDFGTPIGSDHYKYANETLDWWFKEKDKNGWDVELLLETHDVFSDSIGILKLLGELNFPLNLIWDSHHTFRAAGEDFNYSWEKLKSFIKYIHVKDSNSNPSEGHDHTYTLPGEGELYISDLLEILRADNYTGVLSLEWELAWHPYLPTLESAIIKAKEVGWILD